MKNTLAPRIPGQAVALGLLLLAAPATRLQAFPPAPHHEIYGLVRNEFGEPLESAFATVLLTVGGATVASAPVRVTPGPDGNYRLDVPLDSGLTSERYQATAQLPAVPFRMLVKVGSTTRLPLVLTGLGTLVTTPGGKTRVDLTVGEDSDGDGLPDAWERTLIAALGGGQTLSGIRPDGDDDGDGLTNLQEYLAGTYAWDPQDGFKLAIQGVEDGRVRLGFTGLRNRTYTIEGSSDMRSWTPLPFQVGGGGGDRQAYTCPDVRPVQVLALPGAGVVPGLQFFRVMVR